MNARYDKDDDRRERADAAQEVRGTVYTLPHEYVGEWQRWKALEGVVEARQQQLFADTLYGRAILDAVVRDILSSDKWAPLREIQGRERDREKEEKESVSVDILWGEVESRMLGICEARAEVEAEVERLLLEQYSLYVAETEAVWSNCEAEAECASSDETLAIVREAYDLGVDARRMEREERREREAQAQLAARDYIRAKVSTLARPPLDNRDYLTGPL
ncbi:hypothetical protein KIPB_002896 [Kipferlia bialata]|uniref:Uncharacterized protein n=1 Tax=Kipferlia bialata TaxID=797122 RepID=A0A9K3CSY5_9EUKA|nr:hypothetical protein KIPB_002896 [Kipferlia bialata]|eukprot:g2896.t1